MYLILKLMYFVQVLPIEQSNIVQLKTVKMHLILIMLE